MGAAIAAAEGLEDNKFYVWVPRYLASSCFALEWYATVNVKIKGGSTGYIHDHPPPTLKRQIRTAQTECEPGNFCVEGERFLCPAGTFGSSPGLTSLFCSGPCLLGYFCGIGVDEALGGQRCGGAQWYCPEGSATPLEVGVGNYTIGEPPDRRVKQVMIAQNWQQ